jgi:hypothetical protein
LLSATKYCYAARGAEERQLVADSNYSLASSAGRSRKKTLIEEENAHTVLHLEVAEAAWDARDERSVALT